MRFLLDQNVQASVSRALENLDHDVAFSRDLVGAEAQDPIVATAAVQEERILVSHDNDMRRVERYVSDASLARYPTLSRLMFACAYPDAAGRLELFMPVIETWHREANEGEFPMLIEIGRSRLRIFR